MVGMVIDSEITKFPNTGFPPALIASTLAFIVGIICIVLAIFRAGFIDNILSGYLLTGFVLGVSNLIVVEQIPSLLQLQVDLPGDASVLDKFITAAKTFYTCHVPTLCLAISNILFLYVARFVKKSLVRRGMTRVIHVPEIFVLVALMILISWGVKLQDKGIRVLGAFDNHIYPPQLPELNGALFLRLLQPAITIVLVLLLLLLLLLLL